MIIDEVAFIKEAREIKNRKERIAFIYDKACEILDSQFKGINVCGFLNNKCYSQQCNKYTNGCCRKCIYHSNNGCITNNLTCKLFYCGEVTKRYKVLEFKDLKILKLLSLRQRIILKHDYFSSREEVLRDLYIGSLFIFVIRLIFRYRKNII